MSTPLSPEIQVQLENLRDIRLPNPISWWPLAPGWWGVLSLLVLISAGVMIWIMLRKYTVRYLALRELESLRADDPVAFATSLSVLLRRVAMRKDQAIGQLKGADWAAFLSDKGLTPALAQHLAEAPYAGLTQNPPAHATLRDATAQWIRRYS